MRLIPVLDLQAGVIVRAVGGRREEYQPIVSRLSPSPQPVDVARGFREQYGLTGLYLADLDAIAGTRPAVAVYDAIRSLGCSLWVDAGIRDADMATPLARAGVEGIVAGLETLREPEVLTVLCREWGADRILFSLDTKAGLPLHTSTAWASDVESIAAQAIAVGVRRVIVLDLARVGSAGGTGTEELCARLVCQYPKVEIIAGGGLRDVGDLRRLRSNGIHAALVASGLHNGLLQPADIAEFRD
jgi:phosphoribosylformimino-5-aminoimidazole carboxamide ribotide isomerase